MKPLVNHAQRNSRGILLITIFVSGRVRVRTSEAARRSSVGFVSRLIDSALQLASPLVRYHLLSTRSQEVLYNYTARQRWQDVQRDVIATARTRCVPQKEIDA